MKNDIEKFKKKHGYDPNFINPKTYSEKICWRKFFDRRTELVEVADKYRVRNYIRKKLDYIAENYLVPILWVGENPESIPLCELPDEYIIKPNHGAGWWIVKDKVRYTVDIGGKVYDSLSKQEIINICRRWLKEDFSLRGKEWAYGKIKRLLVIEKLIRKKDFSLPDDYRFCMFDGKLRMVYVTAPYQKTFNYYDESWNSLNLKHRPENPNLKKPKEFSEMLEIAEKISKDWDFMRVDFMLANRIYFGEITNYPGGGYTPFPYELDLKIGSYWNLNVCL